MTEAQRELRGEVWLLAARFMLVGPEFLGTDKSRGGILHKH